MVDVPRIIPAVVDVHFRWLGPQGQKCENVYQFKYSATPTSAVLNSLASTLAAAWLAKYQAFMPNTVLFNEVFIKDIAATEGRAQGNYVFPTGTAGARTEDPEPSNVAASLVLRSGLTGRSNHGRKSLSGFVENFVSRDQILNQLLTWLIDLAMQWYVTRTVSGVTFTPVVASNLKKTALPVTQIAMPDTIVDSQKTRLSGHGR